jgi:hypothetical protein
MHPRMLALARLIIGEVQRFPEIGAAYQAAGPDRLLRGMMRWLIAQRSAGRLTFADAELAAQDLWGLILSAPRTQALHQPDRVPDRAELARYIHNGLRVYLRAYAVDPMAELSTLEARLPRHTPEQGPMTLDDYLADPASRFATVAMTDTNGLLRGQMVSVDSLRGSRPVWAWRRRSWRSTRPTPS